MGQGTKALIDKQAAKKAILADTAAKLKAVDAGTYEAAPAKAAPKPRAKKTAVDVALAPATEAAPKPRAARKTKKADEA